MLACFALGLRAGRRHGLADPAAWANGRTARRVSLVALLVGLPAGAAGAALLVSGGEATRFAGATVTLLTAPLLTGGYVVWLARASVAGRLSWAAAAGRQSLSVYLGQSIVLSVVAAGWGLGLYGDLGASATLACAVATYGVLTLLARRIGGRGPFERLLRWWTGPRRHDRLEAASGG